MISLRKDKASFIIPEQIIIENLISNISDQPATGRQVKVTSLVQTSKRLLALAKNFGQELPGLNHL